MKKNLCHQNGEKEGTKRNERAVNFIKISFLNLKMKQAEKRKEKERARIF